MKTQQLQFALAFVALCTLSACDTIGSGRNGPDDWSDSKAAPVVSKSVDEAPDGYLGKPALKAPAPEPVTSDTLQDMNQGLQPVNNLHPVGSSNNLVWHEIRNYNAAHPTLPNTPAFSADASEDLNVALPVAVKYNSSVDVYPVNDDVSPYSKTPFVSITDANGEMLKQVFFAYGSSRISKIERNNLRELAQSLRQNGGEYRLNIVGHASNLVTNVKDPVKRKMINFKMAQKRANAVMAILVKAGATPDWIESMSVGDTQPNPRRKGKSHEAADRRAEVYLNNN